MGADGAGYVVDSAGTDKAPAISRAQARIASQSRKSPAGTLTIFTISRIVAKWEQQGLIETGRERIVIHLPHRLVSIADDLEE